MKTFVCIIAALCSIQLSQAIVCLPNACDSVDCSAAQAELMSCEGRIDATGGYCGCCPACIKQLNEGEICENTLLGTSSKTECGSGLECHPGTKTCVKLESLVKGPCHAEVLRASKSIESGMLGVHLPECLEDGSYAPVQCREGICSCVDKRGNNLYGIQASVSRHSEMNCQCARDKDARKLSMIAFERTCDEIGNYERVQCTRGVCFCVNDQGQKIESLGQVEQENKEQLGGCLVNKKRQDAEQGACARELEMLEGQSSLLGSRKPQCLEDGSYHPRQCFGSQCTCVDSTGMKTEYTAHISQASQMSCECARDKADYLKTGLIGKMFHCDELGNYKDHLIEPIVPEGSCAKELQGIESHGFGAKKPQCLEDGSYHPRQCFGSQCTCVDSTGKETEYTAHISQAGQMSCECARDKADYMKTGLIGKMFHCDELGNYKDHLIEPIVPEGPCAKELQGIESHGLGAKKPQCLEDGSYHPRQCYESVCHCVDSDGKHIGYINSVGKAAHMTCSCARDKADYLKTGMFGKMFNCDSLGNYEQIQCTGSVCRCVDATGKNVEAIEPVPISEVSKLMC